MPLNFAEAETALVERALRLTRSDTMLTTFSCRAGKSNGLELWRSIKAEYESKGVEVTGLKVENFIHSPRAKDANDLRTRWACG